MAATISIWTEDSFVLTSDLDRAPKHCSSSLENLDRFLAKLSVCINQSVSRRESRQVV